VELSRNEISILEGEHNHEDNYNDNYTGFGQQDSETTQSTRHADISEFQVSPISMQEQIARLAYSIWERRNCVEGSADEDWKQAEHELRHSALTVAR
jgi:hypothetical protein